MTVYVVTSGEYSAYQIDAIFETQAEADEFAKAAGAEVTPWELSKWNPELGGWDFQFNLKGEIIKEEYESSLEPLAAEETYAQGYSGALILISVNRGESRLGGQDRI